MFLQKKASYDVQLGWGGGVVVWEETRSGAKRVIIKQKRLEIPLEKKMLEGKQNLLGGSVLGDGLGTLRDGVLGQLTGEDEADSGLDLAGGDGGALVVGSELGGLTGDTLKDIVDEGVQDGHGLVGDSGVGVDLLEDLVDVGRVGLGAGLLAVLATLSLGLALLLLGGGSGLGGGLASGGGLLLSDGGLWGHGR